MAHFGHAQRPFVSALRLVPPGVDGGGGGAGGDDVTVTSAALSDDSDASPSRKKDAFCDSEANNEGRSGGGGGGGGGGGPIGPSLIRRTGIGVESRPEGSSTSTGRCLRDLMEGESKGRCWGDIGGAPGGSSACVEIKILRRVRAESSRRPPRHRRDACSTAWRCRFLAARPSQDGCVIAEK